MITLWGRRNSINVQKVLWTLAELGLAYEHIDAGGDAGGLDDPAFRAMNPHGRVPVLRDGETALWESHSIVRYLCAAYSPGALSPVGALARAGCEAWMDWTLATLQPAIMGLFWGFYRTPPAQRDAARNRDLAADGARAVELLDLWLASRPFVAGAALSVADIPAGTLMFRYFGMDIERPDVPAISAWRARLETRPAYREHVMRPFADLAGRLAY
ncbi:MAG TPA: glutathione S-transferase N-terminal domain-containing protein [Caulobacteraceae bacterium]|jgi:glutathione S-transferase|nr:glutathione S-transferase N-terminal domain-containing protein [Caulobacteraceae bacterium]